MIFSGSDSPEAHSNNERESENKSWWQPGLVLFGRLSGWIAVPVIIALFIGGWLENKYGKSPWLTLLAVAFAFVISMFGIVSEAIKMMDQLEKSKSDAKNIKKKRDKRGTIKNGK